MINIKSNSDIAKMIEAGKIACGIWSELEKKIFPGITTKELDRFVTDYIIERGASPSFLGVPNYYGGIDFPGAICASVNNEVIHGIPDNRKLKEGDIISIDLGVYYDGFHADSARTFPVGACTPEALQLIEVTRNSFFEGIRYAQPDRRVSEISGAIQDYVESHGYSLVKEYTGHGIGRNLHEDPEVPNYRTGRSGVRLRKGIALAVEPMVNQGSADIGVHSNKWTVFTKDGKLSAHYENTIVITDRDPIITTI